MSSIMRRMRFDDIQLSDPFFDSLKEDYKEFEKWFRKKSDDKAYIIEDEHGKLEAFLYLKLEEDAVADVNPQLPPSRRIKVGTFKINAHGTKLGERFIKKIFDHAIAEGVSEIYVTVFPRHTHLINLFRKYGYRHAADKTTVNGTEMVLLKTLSASTSVGDIILDYPLTHIKTANKYLLAIYPEFHTRLLPDSILNNESIDIIKDVSHTNSIHKVYICFMTAAAALRRGDAVIIYRTTDNKGPARFRSVVTSLCVVEELKQRSDFANTEEYLRYCEPYSVFTRQELLKWHSRHGELYVLKMTYNAAFRRRITRGRLLEEVGLPESERWGCMQLTDAQFRQIVTLGEISENLVVD